MNRGPGVWKAEGTRDEYDGFPIFVREAGAGPPLLLIHGFPTSSWDWHRIWPELISRFRVVAPDLIGYGFSAKPRRYPYSTFRQADLVEGLLRSRGIEEAHVLAHDYGDTVLQELLARRLEEPERRFRILSACLLNGGIFVEAIRPRRIQRLLLTPLGPLLGRVYSRRSFDRTFSALFGPRTRPTEDELASYWEMVTRDGGRRILHRLIRYLRERRTHRARWVEALRTTTTPLRFVVGPEDPVSGALMARRYHELIPRPDVVTLDAIGHYPQVEDPEGVLRAFLDFVERRALRPEDT